MTATRNDLVRAGLINARRGLIQVIDRQGRVEISDGTYGEPEAGYRRLIE